MALGMERSMLISLIAFLLFALLGGAVNTVVEPSLIFYILSVGGTKDDYGLTTSSVCIGMTLMMFYFGKWVDSNGHKYLAPLSCAFILGIVGSIIYFLASVLPRGFWTVNGILLGRFIQGMGAGGKMLCNSWIAKAIPLEDQKMVITLLTMVSMGGMALGPPLNILVAEIYTSIPITSTYSIEVNPYNSIGLLLALNEVLLWIIFALFLKDPPSRKEESLASATNTEPVAEADLKDILRALTRFEIYFPIVQQFVLTANFMLTIVALAPVGANMLGWTPVELSTLSVVESVVGFLGMMITMYLAMINTTDFTMIFVGNAFFIIGGVLIYLQWRVDTGTVLTFSLPLMLIFLTYPFSGPANQSSFNKAVDGIPELAGSIGVLQSMMLQGSTIAGIVAPPFVASFVLRDPKDINLDSPYELTLWALYVPISSALMIAGLLYEEFVLGKNELGLLKSEPKEGAEDEVSPDETSKLVSANGFGIVNSLETAYGTESMEELSMEELSSGKEESSSFNLSENKRLFPAENFHSLNEALRSGRSPLTIS
jgi:MFS family permease